jgi:hypothetical protein
MNNAGTCTCMVCHLATCFHPAIIRSSQAHAENEAPQRPGLEQKQDNS